MSGFIEVTMSVPKSTVMLNTDHIVSFSAVEDSNKLPLVYQNSKTVLTTSQYPIYIDESYEEVKRRLQSLFT